MADEPEEKEQDEGADATDWKAMARKWEARSKENAEKAKAYDELQEESKTELQKAKEAAEKAKAELDGLKAKAKLDEARRRVAKSAGVPESLVFGATEDEMEANAKAVAEYAKPKAGEGAPGARDLRLLGTRRREKGQEWQQPPRRTSPFPRRSRSRS